MSEDFRAKVTAELDTAAAESKLEAFLNKNNKLKIDVELNQDSAKKMTSSIEKGLKQTKLDTSSLSKQLAGSFNITDKSTINQIKSQLNGMLSSLSKAWDGLDFNSKSKGMLDFAAGMEPLQKTLAQNAKMIEGSTGIYDEFFNYFKDKQIYISDELKNALGNDTYKELLQNNIGKIVRDAGKGIDISSIWGEMQSLFPEHFSENITTQADQVIHAFDLMKKARAEMAQQMIPYQNMDSQTKAVVDETAWQQVSTVSGMLMGNLKNNIQSAADAAKTTLDLDVNVNTEKVASDLRNAVQNAATGTGEAMNLDLKMNEEQIVSSFRTALSQIATGEEPVKVDIQINKESLKSDLSAALSEMDLPVKFKIDAAELEKQIRAALEKIKDVKMDLHINTDALKQSVGESVTESVNQAEAQTATVRMPNIDTSNMAQFQQLMGNINTAGRQLNIDTTSEATITSSIQALTPEIMVKAGVDSAVVDAWAAEEKKSDGTVKWKNDTGTVDAWAAQMHTSNGTVSWTSFKITGKKTGRAVVSVHPVVSSAATVKLAVTVRRNTYGKHAKTVDAAINKSGYGFTAEERQSIKDSLIIGKSESALNNKKDFDSKTQEAIQKKLKEKLTTWYNSLKNKKFKPSDYQKKHALVQHFNQKGKDVPASKFVDVASILGMKYPNAYSKWTSKQKTNLLKKLQTFGFSKGGVVRNLIPADMGTMLGNAIIRNGDTGFIGARPGETVLTEEFTKLLKPSIASMNEFTDMMTGNNGSKLNNVPSVQNQNITFSPEINLNVDRIDSELDIKDLAHQLSGIMYDDFSTKMTKDWKKDMQKLTGRFR